MLPTLIEAFDRLPSLRALAGSLPRQGARVGVGGLPGSSPAVLTAALARRLPQRVFLAVTATPAAADAWFSDLTVLLGDGVRLYPQRETLGEEEPHVEIAGERVETIEAVLAGSVRVVVTTLRATTELSRMARAVAAQRFELSKSAAPTFADVVARLAAMGYERRPSVLDVAQYAVRGGIVDLYGFGMAQPTRLEWWGDDLISIRGFDLDSQRSAGEIDAVTVLPVAPVGDRGAAIGDRESGTVGEPDSASPGPRPADEADSQSLLHLLPMDTLLVVGEAVDEATVDRIWSEAAHHLDVARRRGEDVPGRDAVFLTPERWRERWRQFARLEVDGEEIAVDFRLAPPPAVERKVGRLAQLVRRTPTMILCDNEGQLERLDELLQESEGDGAGGGRPPSAILALGSLTGGFVLPELTVLTDHEIFRRARRLRRQRRFREALAQATAGSLAPGDYVVHLEHGIGIYRGIDVITVGEDATMEVAVLEYEGGDRLNVPLYRLDQIEPYRSVDDDDAPRPPKLHRLGGRRWRRQRARTEAAIHRMAAELLELYARRSEAEGYGFPPDTRWQRELESSFLYEDTPGQRTATQVTKRDMERSRPMDRLIVGDVGYGKTEVAVRAAFKAVQAGKQVALLVPTTILAEQHGRTFRERLADYPVMVEVLSRFRTRREQRDTLDRLAAGSVDVVIGTHRLFSKDVRFHDLGLMVVDEEHRFGVRHKERLKRLRLEVDVLTLTATPIPRTLHLALSGLRDLTMMSTPPRDRSPVLTYVEPWDDELLAEAIARERDRGGQVFFVHNRIETIQAIAQRVERLAPQARVAVAHGRMRERELDDVMRAFVDGAVDVLVSTMIVESGLDVPNANTMIVHDAHQFGLAQLYQLRGRVGRGHRRAYCYLLVPDMLELDAERRVKVLEHHTELGAGYRIALRDLEIRGAGNLLGAEQSGHAHAVGFDLYLRWLDDTVRALKGEARAPTGQLADITMDGPAYLPDGYVPDEDAKLDFYRRLARSVELGEIAALRAELRDRFGPLPDEAERMLVSAELRALGGRAGVHTITVRGDEARVRFRRDAVPKLMRLTAALEDVQFEADVRQTVPLALRLRRLGGVSTGPGLVRALAEVAEVGTGRSVEITSQE
ncbi:MAG: transcription-repair coupling factor [Gemmatimonadales bacterium]|jgi:transcription-repair coupling factor (superfamily II helicase)